MPKVTYLSNMGIQFGLNESSEFTFVTQKILLLEMNSLHMIVKSISLTGPEFALQKLIQLKL